MIVASQGAFLSAQEVKPAKADGQRDYQYGKQKLISRQSTSSAEAVFGDVSGSTIPASRSKRG
jgi:hypothetical protein